MQLYKKKKRKLNTILVYFLKAELAIEFENKNIYKV